MKTVVTILQLLCGLAIILIVLFQSGKSQGLSGAIGGVADSFLAKNKAKTSTLSWLALPSGLVLCSWC